MSSPFAFGGIQITQGVVSLIPVLAVIVFGRKRVFGFMARRFDRSAYTEDGAFLARMCVAGKLLPGEPYWLKCGDLIEHLMFSGLPITDDILTSEWIRGTIQSVNVDMNKFEVKIPTVTTSFEFQMSKSDGLEGLLSRHTIRCVEWRSLSFENIVSYEPDGSSEGCYQLSRPLTQGEDIDFFVSHSWRDDPNKKWECLQSCATDFMKRRKRYPTFWIDKFCLRQGEHASDALRGLCAYVTACNRTLMLCGPTYHTRLWCVFELFVSAAFQSESEWLRRIKLYPLDVLPDAVERVASVDALTMFNLNTATCYDPNDERLIKIIIDAVGRMEFQRKIQKMALVFSSQMYEMGIYESPAGAAIEIDPSATDGGDVIDTKYVEVGQDVAMEAISAPAATNENVAIETGISNAHVDAVIDVDFRYAETGTDDAIGTVYAATNGNTAMEDRRTE
eukprot:CAMPEP_0185791112 /NCGR_PEP_ID=MMETSP1174-20130828/158192_1 /TAXON_ID=35687 /ORGANISM="Dictyocha speculum, Strain CCMP1381" /LENGTH=447 /DNA_ID=CAMNT_0028486017 /DNA_START=624 /DNA_END=1967 /DNA_ORIENTATION=-